MEIELFRNLYPPFFASCIGTTEQLGERVIPGAQKAAGLKPDAEMEAFAARVNLCPDTKLRRSGFFTKL
jgi:hypothetical protein